MRTLYTYSAHNPSHRPTDSGELETLEEAVAWAAKAADSSSYHSKISVTATEIPDPEYGDRVLDKHTNVIGAVRPGSPELIDRTDSRFPTGY